MLNTRYDIIPSHLHYMTNSDCGTVRNNQYANWLSSTRLSKQGSGTHIAGTLAHVATSDSGISNFWDPLASRLLQNAQYKFCLGKSPNFPPPSVHSSPHPSNFTTVVLPLLRHFVAGQYYSSNVSILMGRHQEGVWLGPQQSTAVSLQHNLQLTSKNRPLNPLWAH